MDLNKDKGLVFHFEEQAALTEYKEILTKDNVNAITGDKVNSRRIGSDSFSSGGDAFEIYFTGFRTGTSDASSFGTSSKRKC